MKKSLLALAIAVGSVAAQAENTTILYGTVGYGITTDNLKSQVVNPVSGSANDGTLTVSLDTKAIGDTLVNTIKKSKLVKTKLGVKGTEDLGGGNQAFFKFEFGINDNVATAGTPVNVNVNTKDENGNTVVSPQDITPVGGTTSALTVNNMYLGFQGGFGKITFGKTGSVWVTSQADTLEDDGVIGGYTDFASGLGRGITYEKDNIANYGIKVGVGYSLANNYAEANIGLEKWGVNFNIGGQFYLDHNRGAASLGTTPNKANYKPQYVAGVSAQYTYCFSKSKSPTTKEDECSKDIQFAVDYEFQPGVKEGTKYNHSTQDPNTGKWKEDPESKVDDKNAVDAQNLVGIGAQYILNKNTLRGLAQFDASAIKDQQKYALGYEYAVTERTKAWFEGGLINYGKTNNNLSGKDQKGNSVYKGNEYRVSVGVRHDF